jgi:hypothetical protein
MTLVVKRSATSSGKAAVTSYYNNVPRSYNDSAKRLRDMQQIPA